jgi:hypothetical protein
MTDTATMTKPKTKLDFVPVIFANGVDDDLPGIAAALRNERVQYEETIYEPFEDIFVFKKKLAFSCARLTIIGHSEEHTLPFSRLDNPHVRIHPPKDTRKIFFDTCHFFSLLDGTTPDTKGTDHG